MSAVPKNNNSRDKATTVSDRSLLEMARAASTRAHAPYSGFAVGAALLARTGEVFTGCNLESASFGLTICAERVALGNAVAAGLREFDRLAVAADCSPPPTPCGSCRQLLSELAPQLEIITGNRQNEVVRYRLSELLPEPFTGGSLQKRPVSPLAAETWRLPLTVRPVGYVRNGYFEPQAVPKDYRQQISRIIIDQDFEEGLYRIEEEKKIAVIGYLHRAEKYSLIRERRGRGGEIYGVFVCRTPRRPNAISYTVVDLISREGPVLVVRGLDLIDGTPVLDIKTALAPKET